MKFEVITAVRDSGRILEKRWSYNKLTALRYLRKKRDEIDQGGGRFYIQVYLKERYS